MYKGPCHTHKVQRLNESTSYTFRIQAFNEAGEGPFSNVYTFTTPRSPPAPVKGTVAALFLFLSFSFLRSLSFSFLRSLFLSFYLTHTHSLSLYILLYLCLPGVDQLSLQTLTADIQTASVLSF